jgi:hypothetical protein
VQQVASLYTCKFRAFLPLHYNESLLINHTAPIVVQSAWAVICYQVFLLVLPGIFRLFIALLAGRVLISTIVNSPTNNLQVVDPGVFLVENLMENGSFIHKLVLQDIGNFVSLDPPDYCEAQAYHELTKYVTFL